MIQYLHLNFYSLKKTGLLLFAVFFILAESFAGDITISAKFRIEVATEDWEQPVVAEISNLESFQVNGASLKYTIRDKISLKVAYEWSEDIGTVEPQSSVTLKAPNPWLPKVGLYQLRYELSSLNDINPTNDTITYDLEVLPNPGFSLKFNQLNFKNPFQQEYSSTGIIDFKISPEVADHYLNVIIGGQGASSQSDWLVQNLPLPAFPDTQNISYWIDLEKIGVTDGMQLPFLKYNYSIDKTPIKEPLITPKMYYADVYADDYDVGGDNPVEMETEETYLEVPVIDWNKDFKVKTWNYRGCNVPNIDLDSSKYNPREMAGEVGDWNSCGPASAVNSLQWLEINHDKIPDTGTDLREKMKIFNKVSERNNEDGLNTAGIIKGKLAFIDSLKLPIHVKWQGIPTRKDSIKSPNEKYNHVARGKNDSVGAYATFEWLASEIEKGEDVEIKFGWYDTLNVRHGGHWVVVTGVSDVTIAQGIYVKDDGDQKKEGGTRQTYVNWVTNEKGRPRLVGFKGKNNRCWVESVVSESYDSTITFTPTSADLIQTDDQLNLVVYENPASRLRPVNIEFKLAEPGDIQVHIYEISGRLVYSREFKFMYPGNKTIEWNGNENNGLYAGSGVYVVKVISQNRSATKKIIIQD